MITTALRLILVPILLAAAALPAEAATSCGEVFSVKTQGTTTTRYSYARPDGAAGVKAVLVLLPGGGGHLDLDDGGCPRALQGNSLVRKRPLFHAAGFATALVDARSDHPGEDGLAGLRIRPEHGQDLGAVVAGLRARDKVPVWVIGTSRGSISAANVAAAGLGAAAAPDGIVLTSALMAGNPRARKDYVAQSVFDLPLDRIQVPVLVIGHADDRCVRSPANLMEGLAARLGSTRKQVVTVSGGAAGRGNAVSDDCAGRTAHGFLGQEAEVVAGIARFIGGGSY